MCAAKLSKSDYAKLSPSGKKKLSSALASIALKGAKRYVKGTGRAVTRTSEPWHKGMAKAAGGAIGNFFGGGPGGRLGAAAGDMFSRITGFGDYRVQSNSLIGMGTDPPAFRGKGRNTIITHREFITDVAGSILFTNTSYPINPGLSASFPWGSQIAQNFEQYRIRGLVYEFKTTCATALTSGTNTAMGTVIMATEYNSINLPFASKSEMENHEFCTSAIPSQSFLHAIECKPSMTTISTQYIRAQAVPSNADVRMYDLGNFQIATVGMQASNIIGELWCTYEIELIKPVMFDSLEQGILADHYLLSIGTVSASNYLGTVLPAPKVSSSNLGTSITITNVLNLPPALDGFPHRYHFWYDVFGASTALTNGLTFTLSAGVSNPLFYAGHTVGRLGQAGGLTTTIQWATFFIDVAAGTANPTITFTGGTLPGTISSADLFIMEASESLQPALLAKPARAPELKESKEEKSATILDDYATYREFMKMRALSARGPPIEDPKSDDDGDDEMLEALATIKARKKLAKKFVEVTTPLAKEPVLEPLPLIRETTRVPSRK